MTEVGPPEIGKLVIGALIWAELLGVSVAWLRLRKTAEWAGRPAGTRRIDLLSRYVGGITALAGLWAALIALVAVGVSAVS
jgi:hypothetical protein